MAYVVPRQMVEGLEGFRGLGCRGTLNPNPLKPLNPKPKTLPSHGEAPHTAITWPWISILPTPDVWQTSTWVVLYIRVPLKVLIIRVPYYVGDPKGTLI